jgi:hypothetical protein
MRGSAPAAHFPIIALGDTCWGAFSFFYIIAVNDTALKLQ